MTEEERDLVNALAGQQGSACDGVPKLCMEGSSPCATGRRPPLVVARHEGLGNVGCPPSSVAFRCASRRARVTFRWPNGRPVRVQNTKSVDWEKRDPSL